VAIHILRMVFAGTFDKHPKLKMIIGHMGEMLPVMLRPPRRTSRGRHRPSQAAAEPTITDQVWITTSGIFTQPPFVAALQTFGIDRIMFSVDYPFARDAQGRKFLDEVSLAPPTWPSSRTAMPTRC
jgi:predicted TIM-barrel fold metal-dependent hydrolase